MAGSVLRSNAHCHTCVIWVQCSIIWVFIRFGGDLLSHVLRRSTIGAVALNGRVRNGAGCFAHAMTTKPKKDPNRHAICFFGLGGRQRLLHAKGALPHQGKLGAWRSINSSHRRCERWEAAYCKAMRVPTPFISGCNVRHPSQATCLVSCF